MQNAPETPEDVVQAVEKAVDMLAEGDVRGATSAWRRLVAKAPRAPEVIVLEGVIAAREGATKEALAAYEKAATIDPQYPLPFVLAAELALLDLDDPDRCLEYCAHAEKAAGDDDDAKAEIFLLEADAYAQQDKEAEVQAKIEQVAALHFEDPVLFQRAGDLALEFGDMDHAKAWFQRVVASDPDAADAWHGLGAVYEALGEREPMIEAWLTTHRLDMEADDAPWHITPQEFERVAEDALSGLPKRILEKLGDVAIMVEDAPSEALVREGTDPRLLGLFSGTPTTEKGSMSGLAVEPDSIRLFQRNLEAAVEDGDHLLEEIRITVLHETAHYFGLEDADLEAMGLG